MGVHCQRNPSDLIWACCTKCPAVLVSNSLLASQGHQEEWELQNPKKVLTWRNLFTVLAGRMRYSGFRKPISCMNRYIRIWIYVGLTRSLKKRTAADVGEGSLGSPFQWPCLSPSQTFMLIYCMHLCSLYQCSIWIGDDTCLRIIKASHMSCVNP